VIVAGIEREKFFSADGVANIKLVRADDIAFGADAEEFWFDRIEIEFWRDWLLENGIQGFDEALAGASAIGGSVFVAIRDPEIGDASFAEAFADGCGDFSAGNAMIDPELADAFVAMGKGKTVGGLGMGKECLIEIEAETV